MLIFCIAAEILGQLFILVFILFILFIYFSFLFYLFYFSNGWHGAGLSQQLL